MYTIYVLNLKDRQISQPDSSEEIFSLFPYTFFKFLRVRTLLDSDSNKYT